jgi:steroid delta-isomerase-like uncharacterized protein
MSESFRRAGDLVVRFYDQLWNSWDDQAVESVLAEQFRFRGSLGQHTVGRDGWRQYRDGIRAAAPDFHNEVVELVADGDRAAARLLYSGTHTGDLLGHPPTGRRFRYAGAAFFRAEDGHLVEAWVLGDLADLTRQLGEQ